MIMNNLLWSPWHGCKKCSPGCLNCYVYYLDSKRGKDASIVTKSITNFNLPLKNHEMVNIKFLQVVKLQPVLLQIFFFRKLTLGETMLGKL